MSKARRNRHKRAHEKALRSWLAKVAQAERMAPRVMPEPLVEIDRDAAWFAVYAAVGSERRVVDAVKRAEWQVYRPTITAKMPCKGAMIERERALFPRYVFIGLPEDTLPFEAVRSIDGVQSFVHVAGTPIRIRASVLQAVAEKVTAETQARDKPLPLYQLGQKVQIADGPFAMFSAVVDELLSDGSIRVLVDILGRATPIQVELAHVRAA